MSSVQGVIINNKRKSVQTFNTDILDVDIKLSNKEHYVSALLESKNIGITIASVDFSYIILLNVYSSRHGTVYRDVVIMLKRLLSGKKIKTFIYEHNLDQHHHYLVANIEFWKDNVPELLNTKNKVLYAREWREHLLKDDKDVTTKRLTKHLARSMPVLNAYMKRTVNNVSNFECILSYGLLLTFLEMEDINHK